MTRLTMADVAKAAGISTALVSIVMRGVPGASDATRARVLRIADELGYVPDERARKLRQSRSRVLGVAFELQGMDDVLGGRHGGLRLNRLTEESLFPSTSTVR